MPKSANSDLKMVRVAQTRPLPPSRQIKSFSQPARPIPRATPVIARPAPSNAVAAHAVNVAKRAHDKF